MSRKSPTSKRRKRRAPFARGVNSLNRYDGCARSEAQQIRSSALRFMKSPDDVFIVHWDQEPTPRGGFVADRFMERGGE